MQKNPDGSAWIQELYEVYFTRLRKIAEARLSGVGLTYMAEDVVQETLKDAYERYATLVAHENIGGWLYQSVYNRCRNLIRIGARRMKSTAFSIDDPNSPDIADRSAEAAINDSVDSTPSYQEAVDYLRDQITEEEYQLFQKAYQEKRSAAELIKEYGVSPNAMGMRMTRLKRKMSKMMAKLLNALSIF